MRKKKQGAELNTHDIKSNSTHTERCGLVIFHPDILTLVRQFFSYVFKSRSTFPLMYSCIQQKRQKSIQQKKTKKTKKRQKNPSPRKKDKKDKKKDKKNKKKDKKNKKTRRQEKFPTPQCVFAREESVS